MLCLLLCGILTACGGGGGTEEDTAAVVKTVAGNPILESQTSQVVIGDVIRRDIYRGIISPYIEELGFPESGVFLEYRVSMGEEVQEGQVLAATDVGDIQERIDALTEQLETLRVNYEYEVAARRNRYAVLEAQLSITYEQIDEAEYLTPEYTSLCVKAGNLVSSMDRIDLEIKQLTETYDLERPYLETRLSEYRKKLRSNVITAPFDGTIVQMTPLTSGSRVTEGESCMAIADTSRFLAVGDYVRIDIAERAERIYVFMDGKEYDAEYIPMDLKEYGALVRQKQTPYSTYEMEASEDFSFGHSVLIVVQHESRTGVLTVPNLAVQQDGARKYCYRDNNGGRERVYIEVGLNDGMNYEVLSGLEEGDAVYIE